MPSPFGIPDPEHLCRLGVDALRQNPASDQRIDEGRLTRAVRTNETDVDVAAAHQLALFEELLLSVLEGLLNLGVLQLGIEEIQGFITEITDAAENFRHGRKIDEVADRKAILTGIFIILSNFLAEIFVIYLCSLENQTDFLIRKLLINVIEEFVALILEQKLTMFGGIGDQIWTDLVRNLQKLSLYLCKEMDFLFDRVVHDH